MAMSAKPILACTHHHARWKNGYGHVSHHEAALLHLHRLHHTTHAPTKQHIHSNQRPAPTPTHSPPIPVRSSCLRAAAQHAPVKRGTTAYTELGRLVHPHAARTHLIPSRRRLRTRLLTQKLTIPTVLFSRDAATAACPMGAGWHDDS